MEEKRVEINIPSGAFEEWMAGFGRDGPPSSDLDNLARNLCSEARPPGQGAELFKALNRTSFIPSSDTVSWKGVSVKLFLQVFMNSPEARAFVEYGCPMWFIRNHCVPQMVIATSSRDSCCLVDCLEVVNSPESLVDKPTVFVSYTGSYTLELFAELAKDLEEHYMWSDVFCVDQIAWRRQGSDFKDDFMYRLRDNIEGIGYTVLLLSKWDHLMGTMGQIWVLWETFATVNSSSRLEVLLLGSEYDRFYYDGLGKELGFHDIFNSLSDIDARKAKARNEDDRIRIFQIMDAAEGVLQVNRKVIERMREWVLETGVSLFGEAIDIMNVEEDGDEAVIDACKMAHNMASLYRDMGNLAAAERLQRKAVKGFCEHLGRKHLDTLAALNALAGMLRMQRKDLNEAKSLYCEVLEQRSSVLGRANLDTLDTANNLANLLTDQLEFDDAKKIYQGALDRLPPFVEHEGLELFDLRVSLNSNLGSIFSQTGELKKASEVFGEVIELCRSRLGTRHTQTIRAVGNMAGVKHRLTDYEESEKLFRECLEMERQIFGESSTQTLQTIHNLAIVLLSTGKLEEAEILFRSAVEGRRTNLGDENRDTLKSVAGLAESLRRQDQFSKAEPLYREAFRLRRKVLGNDHPETLSSTLNLAMFLIRAGETDEGRTLSKKAYDGYRELHGPNHELTRKAKDILSLTREPKGRCLLQ